MSLVRFVKKAFKGIEDDALSYSTTVAVLVEQVKNSKWARPVLDRLHLSDSDVMEGDDADDILDLEDERDKMADLKDVCSCVWQRVIDEKSSIPWMLLPDFMNHVKECGALCYHGTISDSVQQLTTSLVEKFQSAYEEYASVLLATSSIDCGGEICGGYENFDNLSDILQDMIKSIKVFVTFEVKNGVHDELLLPHFNNSSQQPENENIRLPRKRCIGGR
eukprot:gene7717-8556_t